MDGESVKGAMTIRPKDGKRLEHTGIKVQFIGTIGEPLQPLPAGTSNSTRDVLRPRQPVRVPVAGPGAGRPRRAAAPAELRLQLQERREAVRRRTTESTSSCATSCVTVSRRMQDVVREKDIWVYSYKIPPEINAAIKMDVGIEDCLHIEFEYSKSKYHLKDVIVGRIYFLLVRLKIKHMELSIIRRETTGAPPNQYNESETLVRFEVCLWTFGDLC